MDAKSRCAGKMRPQYYALTVILAVLLLSAVLYRENSSDTISITSMPHITINGATFVLEIAKTQTELARGLSERAELSENEGMLFVFDKPGFYGFWMPKMHFAIDIIWIGANQRIVTIAERVLPESYPSIFTPSDPAQYVLEVPAGAALRYGWKNGDETEVVAHVRQ